MKNPIEDKEEIFKDFKEETSIASLDERLHNAEAKIRRLEREFLDVVITLDNMRDKILRKIQTKSSQSNEPLVLIHRKRR